MDIKVISLDKIEISKSVAVTEELDRVKIEGEIATLNYEIQHNLNANIANQNAIDKLREKLNIFDTPEVITEIEKFKLVESPAEVII